MATTTFFERTVSDKIKTDANVDLEFGRCSAYNGESLVYIKVDGKMVILDENTGKDICCAMGDLSHYLGYDA
jgi:hypothetical protein